MRICLFLLASNLLCCVLFCQSNQPVEVKQDSLATFMGVRWGSTAAEFEKNYTNNRKFLLQDKKIIWQRFKFGQIQFPELVILFEYDKKIANTKQWKERLKLKKAYFTFLPEDFDYIRDVLKLRYGSPDKVRVYDAPTSAQETIRQRDLYWIDIKNKRMILLSKYGEYIEKGLCVFRHYDPDEKKRREEEGKRKAAKIF